MRKIIMLSILVLASCSSNDEPCQQVSNLSSKQSSDGSYVYSMQIDHGEVVIINKATLDYYKSKESNCFDGYK